jgi:drug/metabolite transporter (DMT)-like permease
MTATNTEMDLRDWGLLIFLSVLWGGSFLFIGIAVKELPPLVIVLARVAIASAVLLPIHLLRLGPLPRDRQSWITFAGMSLLNNVIPFTLIVTGQTMIASGLASIINATTPLFVVTILALAREESLILRKVMGLAMGIAGVVVLRGAGSDVLGGQTLGIVLCLAAAASYGLSGLWAKRRLKGIAPLTTATGQLLVSTVVMAILVAAFDKPSTLFAASAQTWAAIIGLAVLATALAYIVFFRIIATSGPANVLLVTMLIPVSAILMGHFVLGEELSAREIIGALIICAALAVIDGRALNLLRRSLARSGSA